MECRQGIEYDGIQYEATLTSIASSIPIAWHACNSLHMSTAQQVSPVSVLWVPMILVSGSRSVNVSCLLSCIKGSLCHQDLY